jgi:protein-S-isoprenylcysteine O-methyltransferase Ste14
MRVIDSAIGVLWIAFWLYWVVSATGAKAGSRPTRGFIGMRVGAAVVAVLLIRSGLLGKRAVVHDVAVGLAGMFLILIGLGLAVWARVNIGRNWGMPMTHKLEPELVTSGPYRTIRHPIYTGLIVAMIGTTIAISVYALVPVAALAGYLVYSAHREERYLAAEFPDTYPQYQRGTRMLIPFVY